MNDYDDYEDDQPVTRIKQNAASQKQLGSQILKQAEQYLAEISADEHAHLQQILRSLVTQEAYFQVLADDLDQPVDAKFANDALNLMHFWQFIQQHETDVISFDLLALIETEYFQSELFKVFDELDIGDNKVPRRVILQEALALYQQGFYAGCIALLYAQLEGLLTDVLIAQGYLRQNESKFVDVYKIVPGLKGNEIKSLWHKSKIASELNHYFAELNAYKMDNSSEITATRHNMLHGTDLNHFSRARSFVLFLWLFSAMSFMRSVKA